MKALEHTQQIMKYKQATLFDAAGENTGLQHSMSIKIEGMLPEEYRNGGEHLSIHYSFAESPFGDIIIASTRKGVCYLAFVNDIQKALTGLQKHFPNAGFRQTKDIFQLNALRVFTRNLSEIDQINLHLRGTAFQLKVWELLLKIPMGQLSTYGNMAGNLQNPNASRAAGAAIGSNPVAFLIPCHRVIRSNGSIGGYMWGTTRKRAIIEWEATRVNYEPSVMSTIK